MGGTLSSLDPDYAESQPRNGELGVDEHELQHRLMELERYDSDDSFDLLITNESFDPLILPSDT